MTLSLRTLIAVTTLLLGTTSAPAVAVDEIQAPKRIGYSPFARDIQDAKPGAHLAWQMEQLHMQLFALVRAYRNQVGHPPATIDELMSLDGIFFLPKPAIDGQPPTILRGWTRGETIGPGVIALEVRPEEIVAITMGANGDPLAPLQTSVQTEYAHPGAWPLPVTWHTRRLRLAAESVRRQVELYLELHGHLPASSEALSSTTRLSPIGAHWQEVALPMGDGLLLEVRPDLDAIRVTCYESGAVVSVEVASQSPSSRALLVDHYGSFLQSGWQPVSFLAVPRVPEPVQPRPEPLAFPDAMFRIPPSWSGSLILAQEYASIASLHQYQHSRLPDIAWLCASRLSPHQPLSAQGVPVQPQAYDPATASASGAAGTSAALNYPPGPRLRIDPQSPHGTIGFVADIALEPVAGGPQPVASGSLQRGESRVSIRTVNRRADSALCPFKSAAGFDPEPAIAWFQANAAGAPPDLRKQLWTDLSRDPVAGWPYQYLDLCAESLRRLLNVAMQQQDPFAIVDVASMVQQCHLSPRTYRFLAPGETPRQDCGHIELALNASRRLLRTRATLPGGESRDWYSECYVAVSGPGQMFIVSDVRQEDYRDAEATHYEPVASVEIAIPFWPEATP